MSYSAIEVVKKNYQRRLGEVVVTVEDVILDSRLTRTIPTQNGTADKRLLRAPIKAWPLQ